MSRHHLALALFIRNKNKNPEIQQQHEVQRLPSRSGTCSKRRSSVARSTTTRSRTSSSRPPTDLLKSPSCTGSTIPSSATTTMRTRMTTPVGCRRLILTRTSKVPVRFTRKEDMRVGILEVEMEMIACTPTMIITTMEGIRRRCSGWGFTAGFHTQQLARPFIFYYAVLGLLRNWYLFVQ